MALPPEDRMPLSPAARRKLINERNPGFEDKVWWPAILEKDIGSTYPMPKDGWVCFHCGERFTTPGSAKDHFGATPNVKPGCLIKIQLGDERGLLMELRKVEQENARLRAELAELKGSQIWP